MYIRICISLRYYIYDTSYYLSTHMYTYKRLLPIAYVEKLYYYYGHGAVNTR